MRWKYARSYPMLWVPLCSSNLTLTLTLALTLTLRSGSSGGVTHSLPRHHPMRRWFAVAPDVGNPALTVFEVGARSAGVPPSSGGGQRESDDRKKQTHRDILRDDALGPTSDFQQEWDMAEVIMHQCHAG